jgi:hypothetical protein
LLHPRTSIATWRSVKRSDDDHPRRTAEVRSGPSDAGEHQHLS